MKVSWGLFLFFLALIFLKKYVIISYKNKNWQKNLPYVYIILNNFYFVNKEGALYKLVFYTDGACSGNPGPGGYGVLGTTGSDVVVAHQEFCDNTTNNREELKAILWVLERYGADEKELHTVYSDSAYAVNTINTWIHNWAAKGWLKSNNQVPENLDIIKKIYDLKKQGYRIDLIKIAGHKGILGNEMADRLATGYISAEELLAKERK